MKNPVHFCDDQRAALYATAQHAYPDAGPRLEVLYLTVGLPPDATPADEAAADGLLHIGTGSQLHYDGSVSLTGFRFHVAADDVESTPLGALREVRTVLPKGTLLEAEVVVAPKPKSDPKAVAGVVRYFADLLESGALSTFGV